MNATLIVSLAAVIIAGLGTVAAAIVTRGKKDNPGNSYVREATCNALHKGISQSLEALWSEYKVLDGKMDRVMMHFKIDSN